MKIYDLVEQAIQKSVAQGDPDKLTNKGQRLELSEWQRTPEHLRMGHTVLKNGGIKPMKSNSSTTLKISSSRLKA
jgi:hypothetical protein